MPQLDKHGIGTGGGKSLFQWADIQPVYEEVTSSYVDKLVNISYPVARTTTSGYAMHSLRDNEGCSYLLYASTSGNKLTKYDALFNIEYDIVANNNQFIGDTTKSTTSSSAPIRFFDDGVNMVYSSKNAIHGFRKSDGASVFYVTSSSGYIQWMKQLDSGGFITLTRDGVYRRYSSLGVLQKTVSCAPASQYSPTFGAFYGVGYDAYDNSIFFGSTQTNYSSGTNEYYYSQMLVKFDLTTETYTDIYRVNTTGSVTLDSTGYNQDAFTLTYPIRIDREKGLMYVGATAYAYPSPSLNAVFTAMDAYNRLYVTHNSDGAMVTIGTNGLVKESKMEQGKSVPNVYYLPSSKFLGTGVLVDTGMLEAKPDSLEFFSSDTGATGQFRSLKRPKLITSNVASTLSTSANGIPHTVNNDSYTVTYGAYNSGDSYLSATAQVRVYDKDYNLVGSKTVGAVITKYSNEANGNGGAINPDSVLLSDDNKIYYRNGATITCYDVAMNQLWTYTPVTSTFSMAIDSDSMYVVTSTNMTVTKLNRHTGTVTYSKANTGTLTSFMQSLVANNVLYVLVGNSTTLHRFNPADGAFINTLTIPLASIFEMTYGGGLYLYFRNSGRNFLTLNTANNVFSSSIDLNTVNHFIAPTQTQYPVTYISSPSMMSAIDEKTILLHGYKTTNPYLTGHAYLEYDGVTNTLSPKYFIQTWGVNGNTYGAPRARFNKGSKRASFIDMNKILFDVVIEGFSGTAQRLKGYTAK